MSDGPITAEELALLAGEVSTPQVTPPSNSRPAEEETPSPVRTGGLTARPAQFTPLQPAQPTSHAGNLDLLLNVSLQVSVELGRTRMSIEEILKLGPGSVIELDKLAGEPVDILVNDRLIAHGEVVVLDDRFGVRITDVLSPSQRIHSLK